MARLKELIPAMRILGPVGFVRKVSREVSEDELFAMAAAMAYAWLFAIFPFIIFLLTLAPYLPRTEKARVQLIIETSVSKVIAHEGAQTIRDTLDVVLNQPRTGLLSLGLLVTLWTASGGVAMTMCALDTAFDAPHCRPFYKQRPLAILLTVIMTVLILLVMVLMPVGTAVTGWLASQRYFPQHILHLLNFARYVVAILLMLCVLAMLYTFGPTIRQRFAFLSPGALFTVLVWIVLAEVFRFYVDKFGRYERTYGAIGGVTIVLFFFYLDALVLLIGAEINSEVDAALHHKNKPAGHIPPAAKSISSDI